MGLLNELGTQTIKALDRRGAKAGAQAIATGDRTVARKVARPLSQDALALSSKPAPAARHLWSRAVQTDAKGFYYMPVGICDDFENTDLTKETRAQIETDFKAMHDLGVKELRLGMSWLRIQTGKNEFDWAFWDHLVNAADRHQIRLMPYVCYTPEWIGDGTADFWHHPPTDPQAFADFVGQAAQRYKGKIQSWELWNEPDNPAYWDAQTSPEASADKFANMITPAVQKLRQVAPDTGVILGGMSVGRGPFFDRLMTAHQLGNQVDAVNVHSYYKTWNEGPEEQITPHLQGMQDLIDQTTGADKPALNMDEFGYSSHRFSQTQASQWGNQLQYAYEHTPEYQAQALFKDHTMALASGTTSHVAWYRIRDLQPEQTVIGDNNNLYLGLLDPQGKPKPAYQSMKFFNRLFNQPTKSLDGQVKLAAQADSQAQVHVIQKQDGKTVVVGWLRDSAPSEVADSSGMAQDTRKETLSLQIPGLKFSKLTQYDPSGKRIAASAVVQGDRLANIPLQGGQLFIGELTP